MSNNFNYTIHDKIIWDFTDLVTILKKEIFVVDMDKIFSKPLNQDYVSFCFIKFNVKSVIYEKSIANEVFDGYKLVIEDFNLKLIEYLIETIFGRFVDEFKTYFSKDINFTLLIEPSVTILLRFFYWYYKCSKIFSKISDVKKVSQASKRKEIRSKISKKFLKIFEKYHQSIKYTFEFNNDEELIEWSKLQQNTIPLPKSKHEPEYKKYIKELTDVLKNINSELMLASLCSQYYNVYFDIYPSNEHDFDFVMNDIGVQVKTISKESDENEKNSLLEKLEIDGFIDQLKLEKEFFKFLINNNRIDHLEKSIEKQKARIIFFNINETLIGMAIKRLILEKNFDNLFQHSLNDSIKLATDNNSNYLPLIVFVSHSDYVYFINSIYLKIPIVKKEGSIDLDRDRVQGFSSN